MTTFASLVTIAILIASMYGGYRFNMYLYARGALGTNARRLTSLEEKRIAAFEQENEASLVQVRDYGLRYARTGILVFAILVSIMILFLVTLVFSVL